MDNIDIEFIDKVRREGTRVGRYDLVTDNGYDDTQTIFIYQYNEFDETCEEFCVYNVYIKMYKGQYLEYTVKELYCG